MAKKKREILTGVEIGTSAIKVVMGEFLPDDVISIVGVGKVPSMKVVKGEIVDVNVVQEQLEMALAKAEEASGLEIDEIFLAVTGAHIQSVNSVGSTMVTSPDSRIGEDDIVTAHRNAHAYHLPPDKKVLHYLDRCYQVDGGNEITNPLGLVGAKLEADVQIIYGQHNRLETNCRMINDAMTYPAEDIAFSGIAAALATFSSEDTEKGGLLLDIGAGVTEYVVLQGPGCFHSGQLTVGCEHIANDLSLGLRLPINKCRKILHDLDQFGSAVMTPDGHSRLMAVERLAQSPRHIPISTVEHIVELRLRELFETIRMDLEANNALERIGCGIRICGGGAHIPGIDRLVRQVFQMPASIAKPRLLSGKQKMLNSPEFLTPVGLIRWGKMMLDISPKSNTSFWESFYLDLRKAGTVLCKSFPW